MEYIKVTVIDGDTVLIRGTYYRLLGIDAPEKSNDEEGYNLAKLTLENLFNYYKGSKLKVVYDKESDSNVDIYGRHLVWIIVEDINGEEYNINYQMLDGTTVKLYGEYNENVDLCFPDYDYIDRQTWLSKRGALDVMYIDLPAKTTNKVVFYRKPSHTTFNPYQQDEDYTKTPVVDVDLNSYVNTTKINLDLELPITTPLNITMDTQNIEEDEYTHFNSADILPYIKLVYSELDGVIFLGTVKLANGTQVYKGMIVINYVVPLDSTGLHPQYDKAYFELSTFKTEAFKIDFEDMSRYSPNLLSHKAHKIESYYGDDANDNGYPFPNIRGFLIKNTKGNPMALGGIKYGEPYTIEPIVSLPKLDIDNGYDEYDGYAIRWDAIQLKGINTDGDTIVKDDWKLILNNSSDLLAQVNTLEITHYMGDIVRAAEYENPEVPSEMCFTNSYNLKINTDRVSIRVYNFIRSMRYFGGKGLVKAEILFYNSLVPDKANLVGRDVLDIPEPYAAGMPDDNEYKLFKTATHYNILLTFTKINAINGKYFLRDFNPVSGTYNYNYSLDAIFYPETNQGVLSPDDFNVGDTFTVTNTRNKDDVNPAESIAYWKLVAPSSVYTDDYVTEQNWRYFFRLYPFDNRKKRLHYHGLYGPTVVGRNYAFKPFGSLSITNRHTIFKGSPRGIQVRLWVCPVKLTDGAISHPAQEDMERLSFQLTSAPFLYGTEEREMKFYVENNRISTAKYISYFDNRVLLYGADNAHNIIYMSDINNPSYFPLKYTLDQFDAPVVHVQPYLQNLIVFTTRDIYIVVNVPEEVGEAPFTSLEDRYYSKKIVSNITLETHNKNTVVNSGKILMFVADKNVYALRPNIYVEDPTDLQTINISKAISELLQNPTPFIVRRHLYYGITSDIFSDNFKPKLNIRGYVNNNLYHIFISSTMNVLAEDIYMIELTYNIETGVWNLYDTKSCAYPTDIEVFDSIEGPRYLMNNHEDLDNGTTVMQKTGLNLWDFEEEFGRIFDIKAMKITQDLQSMVYNTVLRTAEDDEIFKVKQPIRPYINTGAMHINPHLHKRFNSVNMEVSNFDCLYLPVSMDLSVDGHIRKSSRTASIMQVLNDSGTPVLTQYQSTEMDEGMSFATWEYDLSRFGPLQRLRIKFGVHGRGRVPEMEIGFKTTGMFELYKYGIIYKEQTVR